jgi:hypothetical protein
MSSVEIDTNQVICKYLLIANYIKPLDQFERYLLIKYIENYFEDQCDTELGDFIEEMVWVYLYSLDDDDLHIYIREVIDCSECNLEMLDCVSNSIISVF